MLPRGMFFTLVFFYFDKYKWMSSDIIEHYKNANAKKDTSTTVESYSSNTTISATSDPFGDFLLELSDKLKNVKIDNPEKAELISEVVVEEKEKLSNDTDSFSNFLSDFSKILDKEVNKKEEKVKNSTIDFINNLKEQKVVPNKRKKKKIPNKFADKIKHIEPLKENEIKEEIPVKNNTYVDSLKNIDKAASIPEKVKNKTDIKTFIAKHVKDEVEKFKVQFSKIALEGGGSGSVAVQYAKGGTMNGDLNVTGKYLSAGVDLSSIIGTGGSGGEADRLVSGSQSLILNADGTLNFPSNFIVPPDGEILNIESETNTSELSGFTRISLSPFGFFAYDNNNNSISFSTTDNDVVISSQDQYEWTFNKEGVLVGPHGALTVNSLSSLGRILSGDRDLADIFLTSETDSQTLTYTASSYELSISNGNTVSLASLSSVTYTYRFDYIPDTSYSGKAVSGSLESDSVWTINRTIFTNTGTVSATGKATSVAWTDRLSAIYI